MPFYLFSNPRDPDQVHSVFFHMRDKKEYTYNGYQWDRVWLAPGASVDSNADPFSKETFMNKTNKSDTIGALQERSAELSDKRAQKMGGADPIKEGFYKDWAGARKPGAVHPDIQKRQVESTMKAAGIKFEL